MSVFTQVAAWVGPHGEGGAVLSVLVGIAGIWCFWRVHRLLKRVPAFEERPAAAPNAAWLAGASARDLRSEVLERLQRTNCCTHLNDALRSLAEVPVKPVLSFHCSFAASQAFPFCVPVISFVPSAI